MPKTITMPPALAEAPKFFRTAKASGSKPRVDREGGKYGAGLISQVSLITKGEASGHEMWIDDVFLDQLEEALSAEPTGVKSRWTHPGMSSDGMGKMTSRIMDPVRSKDGGQLVADQHFLKIGHRSPDGDLAAYQMDLADEDPSAYGLSIVFMRDFGAMDLFRAEHSDETGNFKSPDKENVNNFEHARLHQLFAADAVDEPAANPNGLFSREKDLAREADAVARFALGLTAERPAVVQLGLDPDRVRGFASRFLSTHNLELRTKAMAPETKPADDSTAPVETKPAETKPAEGAAPETKPAEAGETQQSAARAEAAKFRSLFGDVGAVWYAEGLSLEAAQQRANASLGDRLTALETQLKAAGNVNGETKPAGFNAGDKNERKGFASKIRFVGAPAK